MLSPVLSTRPTFTGRPSAAPKPYHAKPADHLQIRFGQSEGLSKKALETIHNVVSKCQYGVNIPALLDPDQDFQALNFRDGNVVLKNYSTAKKEAPPFTGVCNELAYQVGRYLQQELGNDVEIKAVRGKSPEYFDKDQSTHYFLIAYPAIQSLSVGFGLHADKSKLPKNCVLIDPSFGVVSQDLGKYKIDEILPYDKLAPETNTYFHIADEKLAHTTPVGFLRDVAPELVKEYGEKAMLYLSISGFGELQSPRLLVQRSPESTEVEYLRPDQVPRHSPLFSLMRKILTDLMRSPDETMQEELEYRCHQLAQMGGPMDLVTDYRRFSNDPLPTENKFTKKIDPGVLEALMRHKKF